MNQIIRAFFFSCTIGLVAGQLAAQERWELGVAGGYGFSKDVTIEGRAGEASGGLRPGVLFSVVAGNQVRSWLSGEVRYTYRQNDLKLKGGGAEARFDGDSHAIHYDFVFSGGDKEGIQPFVAAGAGIRFFRGTGVESSAQPLNRIAILTKTSDLRPLLSVGGGVKVPLSSLLSLRVEARDYITPFPKEVIAPLPGGRTRGWLHDIVPMIGLSFTF